MEPTEVQLDPETESLPEVPPSDELPEAAPSEGEVPSSTEKVELPDGQLRAIVEAVIYVTDEPLSADQIATALQQPAARIGQVLAELTAEYNKPERGLTIREIAGGYKLSTKPEHHEAIRAFVKNLKPPLKLSLAALETLALIAYKQPITAPEIMEVRGVQGAGVIKTLIDRKLIATAGRKTVLGKPMQYKTTKEFLVQFGLNNLTELPTLKEFEELGRLSVAEDTEPALQGPAQAAETTKQAGAEEVMERSQPAAAASGEAATNRVSDDQAERESTAADNPGEQPESPAEAE